MIDNPLIRREFVGQLRTWRALVMLAGVALAFALLTVLRWPSDGVVDYSGEQARAVFRVFALTLAGAVMLLVPVFPATSIVVEKRKGTLALLLNSTLTPFSIYFGKLIAALGFVVLLLLVTLPALAACNALGGVSLASHLFPLYGVLGLASLQFTTWGLLVSTRSESTDGAVRGTFGGVLAMAVLVLVPDQFLHGSEGSLANLSLLLKEISPIPAILQITGQSGVGSRGLISSVDHVAEYLKFGSIASAVFAAATIRLLGTAVLDRARSQGQITDDRSKGVRVARRLFFLIDPQRRKSGIAPFVNPVLVKEFRSRQFGRSHWMLRLISGCALLSLILSWATTLGSEQWGVEEIGGIIVTMQIALVALLTPGISSGLISSERESGSWQLLRMTPLTTGRIVRGKLISVLWTLLLILLATLPGYGVMILIKPVLREQIFQVMVCLVLSAVFALMLSATVSSFFAKTAPATVTSYSLLLALWAGTLLIWLGRDAPFGYSTVKAALTLNPMAAALSVMGTSGFESYDLVPANWWVMSASCAGLLVILLVQTARLSRPD